MFGSQEPSRFEEFVFENFGRNPQPGYPQPLLPLGVFLCFVNRGGSNYFAECLASSGSFPRAREVFLKSNLLRIAQSHEDFSGAFKAIVGKHACKGVFAAKLGFSQLDLFESLGYFDAAFERRKFLLLERRDVLAQSISLEIASQRQEWVSGKGKSIGRGQEQPLDYSRKRIELKMEGIRRKYERFREFFAIHPPDCFHLTYEDLVDHPVETVAAAGEFLGLPLQYVSERVGSERSPDGSIKEIWKQRFLAGE